MLHQTQVIQTGYMVVRNFKSSFEHVDGLVILLSILVGQTFAVVELRVAGHQLDCMIKIFMRKVDLLKRKVGITSIEEGPSVIRIQVQSLVVFCQALIIHLVVVECQSLIVEVGGFCAVKLNCFFKPLKG